MSETADQRLSRIFSSAVTDKLGKPVQVVVENGEANVRACDPTGAVYLPVDCASTSAATKGFRVAQLDRLRRVERARRL